MASSRLARLLSSLSIFCLLYWLIVYYFNAYRYAFTGALFEMTALPVLAIAFGLMGAYIYFFLSKKLRPAGWNLVGMGCLLALFLFLQLNQ